MPRFFFLIMCFLVSCTSEEKGKQLSNKTLTEFNNTTNSLELFVKENYLSLRFIDLSFCTEELTNALQGDDFSKLLNDKAKDINKDFCTKDVTRHEYLFFVNKVNLSTHDSLSMITLFKHSQGEFSSNEFVNMLNLFANADGARKREISDCLFSELITNNEKVLDILDKKINYNKFMHWFAQIQNYRFTILDMETHEIILERQKTYLIEHIKMQETKNAAINALKILEKVQILEID